MGEVYVGVERPDVRQAGERAVRHLRVGVRSGQGVKHSECARRPARINREKRRGGGRAGEGRHSFRASATTPLRFSGFGHLVPLLPKAIIVGSEVAKPENLNGVVAEALERVPALTGATTALRFRD